MFGKRGLVVVFTLAFLVLGVSAYAFDVSAQQANSKTFVLWADTHYGNTEGNGAADDIAYSVQFIKDLNPDFLLHIGDLADRGKLQQFGDAKADIGDIIQNTNVVDFWPTFGGSHDGWGTKEKYGGDWNGAVAKFGGKIPSLYYTIQEGNNVFIFVNIVQGDDDWDNDWGDGRSHFIPQNVLDNWLEPQLAKYNNTDNNVFVIAHTPVRRTNAFSNSFSQMQKGGWVETSRQLKELFSEYRVDVYIHGHVHMDPDQSHSKHPLATPGNVLIAGYREDLPHTTFLHATDVNWEHSVVAGTQSTYPSVMYFDLVEGQDYFALKAQRVDTDVPAGITYNDELPVQEVIVPLSHPVTNLASTNGVDYYEQGWDVWELSPSEHYQWFKDSEGLRVAIDGSWIGSAWDLWEEKDLTGFGVDWTGSGGSMDHKFFCSNNAFRTWSGPYNTIQEVSPCRWLGVRTTFQVDSGEVYYVKNMEPIFSE